MIQQFAGQSETISKILRHPVGIAWTEDELLSLTKDQLARALQWCRENPVIHHEPGTRDPLRVEPVEPAPRACEPPAIDALPSWAQDAARRNMTRRTVRHEARAPRYKAQLWDNGYTVHLGMFDSPEARDAAVRDAKTRRALGLPIKG